MQSSSDPTRATDFTVTAVTSDVKPQSEAGPTGEARRVHCSSPNEREYKPGESLVKPWLRELLHDYGRNAEIRWEAMANQNYETLNNRFYVRSRVLGLPWLTRLP
ncbi:MAG: hypothetical protein WKF67_04250, partial [Rubrobacteraceae bacterium]